MNDDEGDPAAEGGIVSAASSSSSPPAAAAGVGGGSIIIGDADAADAASGREGIATLTWQRCEDDDGGRVSTVPMVMFLLVAAATPSAGAGAAVAEGVAQPGPKKPAAAGVPGESGAVAVASIGQALASDADTVRETRRPSLPAGLVAASTAAGFLGVAVVSLGVQQFFMHGSQIRFAAV